jgi:hypothetical protein
LFLQISLRGLISVENLARGGATVVDQLLADKADQGQLL